MKALAETAEHRQEEPPPLEACKKEVDRLVIEFAAFLTRSPTPTHEEQRAQRLAMANEFRRLMVRSSPTDIEALQEHLDAKFRQWEIARQITLNRGKIHERIVRAPALVLGTAAVAAAHAAESMKNPVLQLVDTGTDFMAKGVKTVATRGAEGVEGMKQPLIRAIDAGAELAATGASQIVSRTAEGLESMTRRSKVPIMRAMGDIAEIAVGTAVEVLKGVLRGLARFATRT